MTTQNSKARILLFQPWNYHDELSPNYDPSKSWRNGPFNIALLATVLNNHSHKAKIVDLEPYLLKLKGDVEATLDYAERQLLDFKPDIVGVTFFSVHYIEVKKLMQHLRNAADRHGLDTIFVAGGIHASIAPQSCIDDLMFDYAFIGEAETGLLQLAEGHDPLSVQGVYNKSNLPQHNSSNSQNGSLSYKKAQFMGNLDDLPFVDWGLLDYKFYSHPSSARLGFQSIGSLDLEMGRGCVYKCSFCAYNALSGVRFHTAEYIVENMVYNYQNFGVTGFYFTESTIGNNRKIIREMCEILIERQLNRKFVWLGNIRSNQVSEKDLRLMWRAGCRYLFYGFESNSQQVLDAMQKQCSVEANEKAAELHNRLYFPYHASMLFGFPGETADDVRQSIDFLARHKPPSIGINSYVPLPGSPDYDNLLKKGIINHDGPEVWRSIGEVNPNICYANMPPSVFHDLYKIACKLAYDVLPRQVRSDWQKQYALKTSQIDICEPIPVFRNIYSHIPPSHTEPNSL